MSQIEQRLKELGIELKPAPAPKFSYIPCVRTGNLLYLSGQVARANGELLFTGKLGREVSIEQGKLAARQTIINSLAVLKDYLGDLDRVVQVVKMLGFVNSAPGFVEHPVVINGASDLLIEVFGEKGRHARSAIGTSELPYETPVEVELIVEIRD